MEIKNADGVMIERTIPESLVSNYEAIGWKVVEKKKDFKEEKEVKEDNKPSQNSLNK